MLLSAAQAWVWTCAGGKTWTGPRDLKWAFPQLDQNTQVRSVCVCVFRTGRFLTGLTSQFSARTCS